MNIKDNRFVLFIGPVLWVLAGMITTRTFEHCIYTIWLGCTISYDIIEMRHRVFYKYTPAKITEYRKQLLTQNIIMCFITSTGFPSLSFLSALFLKLKSPYKVSFTLGILWAVWYICSFCVDYSFLLNCEPKWYGVLLFVWSIVQYSLLAEMRKIGMYSTIVEYRNIWIFRFLDQYVINSIRWFIWCDCVFPYQTRWDMFIFGTTITILCMYFTNIRKPHNLLTFTKNLGDHMPAPDTDTALLCNKCRESQQSRDVEHGQGLESFTL